MFNLVEQNLSTVSAQLYVQLYEYATGMNKTVPLKSKKPNDYIYLSYFM